MAKIRVNISLDAAVLEDIDALAEEHTGGDRSAWIAQAASHARGRAVGRARLLRRLDALSAELDALELELAEVRAQVGDSSTSD